VLPDQLLLGGSVALVVVGGLLATALSRQDAAEVASLRFGQTLAMTTALLPAGAAVVLVAALRPDLLGVMWWTLARIVELALTPLGLLLTWLASLFPPATRGFEALPPGPLPDLAPDLAALGELHDQTAWIGMAIALALILVAGVATLIVVRLLLAGHIRAPVAGPLKRGPELTVERSGNPRGDVADFWAWLLRLLRRRLVREHRSGASHGAATSEAEGVDAWAVYRGLLSWAEQRGHGRRPSETTGQLQARLVRHVPESIEAVDLVTRTYEGDRYGGLHPSLDHLRRLRQALATLRR
jgi:hypothetical protein